MGEAELILIVSAHYVGAVGFADVFRCRVSNVVAGGVEDKDLSLTVLPEDRDKLEFLTSHPPPDEIEIGFSLSGKDTPYGVTPVTGFVDSHKTAWKVAYMRAPGAIPT